MAQREVFDLLIGMFLSVAVIFILSFFNPKASIEHVEKPNNPEKNDWSQIETDQRLWVIKCRKALNLNESQFHTKVDKIFEVQYPNLKRKLTLNDEDIQYRLEWHRIAEKILQQNQNFNKTENCMKKQI